ncbi:MAG: YXWGXW repeat-containing protein [Verrucomicrobiota bacterium]
MSPKFCRRLTLGPGVAVLLFSAASTFAANAGGVATVPPAPLIEKPLTPAANDTPGDQPSSQHVWVQGHWRWNEGAYVWEAGRWEVPPTSTVVWHAPEWQQQANGFVLREGYWAEPTAQPAQVVAAPAAAPQTVQVIYADQAPPPPQREMIYERPSGGHVWVPGYWSFRGGRHVWVGGHWVSPPRNNLVWVPARWEARGGRYVLLEGYWRDGGVIVTTPPPAPPQQVVVAPPPQQQVIVMAPPPPRQEVVYARPSRNHVWVPGYWNWAGGRYVWMAGHYALPPRGHVHWDQPRWERRGGNYVFIEGRWR